MRKIFEKYKEISWKINKILDSLKQISEKFDGNIWLIFLQFEKFSVIQVLIYHNLKEILKNFCKAIRKSFAESLEAVKLAFRSLYGMFNMGNKLSLRNEGTSYVTILRPIWTYVSPLVGMFSKHQYWNHSTASKYHLMQIDRNTLVFSKQPTPPRT